MNSTINQSKKQVVINTDGGSRGNPGPAAIGVVTKMGGAVVFEKAATIGVGTNNEAEYQALISALEWLKQAASTTEVGSAHVYLDSKLVVEQVAGRWKIKEPRLKPLASRCQLLINFLEKKKSIKVSLEAIPRSKNSQADSLVNQALDAEQQAS